MHPVFGKVEQTFSKKDVNEDFSSDGLNHLAEVVNVADNASWHIASLSWQPIRS